MRGSPVLSWIAIAAVLGAGACAGSGPETIRIGSKNFTEQVILGELLAALIEHDTDLNVDRRLNLGGTFVCHKALVAGELDLYVEYTGTALSAILERPPSSDSSAVYDTVRSEYARRFAVRWMPPLGFSNTFALIVRPEDARAHGLRSIADLASVADTFRAGFGYEFIERADGYRGLAEAYDFELSMEPREMELGLLYRALSEKQVDLVVGNSTDGLIDSLGLVMLDDDRSYFPAYDAAPVIRDDTLREHPELEAVLGKLGGAISEDAMRRMNYAVTGESRAPAAVAAEFLEASGLTGAPED